MESKLRTKIDDYCNNLKQNIFDYIKLNIENDTLELDNIKCYIDNIESFNLLKEDLKKRTRKISSITDDKKCKALKKNGTRCSRSRQIKNNSDFCGTHINKQPHGIVDIVDPNPTTIDIQVRKQNIDGIIHFIDDFNNVYDTISLHKNENPVRIGTYNFDKITEKYTIDLY